jgi:hypothetical protein
LFEISPSEIADALVITDVGNRSQINSASKALVKAGLGEFTPDGRLFILQDEIRRLTTLSSLKR